MRELRDPQNGCQIRKVPQNGYTFPMDSLHKGATTIQSVGPLPPAEVIPSKVEIYEYNEYKWGGGDPCQEKTENLRNYTIHGIVRAQVQNFHFPS